MNQGLATLAEHLAATLKDDNNLRRAAEEELTKLSQNSEEYLEGLLQLVSVSHPDVSSQLKNAAAINLKKQIKDLCDSPSITKDQRLSYAKKIFLVLVTNGLDSSVRGSLGYALVPLFAGQPDVLVPFQPILAEAMSTGTYNLLGSIKTIKSIYSGFVHNPVLYPFFKKILPNFISIAYKTLSFSVIKMYSE